VSKIKYIKTKLTNNLRAEERSYWQLLTIAQFRFEIKNIHCFSQIDYTVTRKFKNKYRVDTVRENGGITPIMVPILLRYAPKTVTIFLVKFPMQKWN